MLEPLLLTVAVITVPFGLYLAFDRGTAEKHVQRRINRHERAREALRRLSQSEAHWDPHHLRFELRQNYRAIQKARLQGEWESLAPLVSVGPLEEWKRDWSRREATGVRWTLDPLEIIDVQPVNIQNRPGYDKDFVTVEIETRRRDFLQGEQGCYQEGSGFVGPNADMIPIEMVKEYWTFVRREQAWMLVRCDRQFPENLAFIDEEEESPIEN